MKAEEFFNKKDYQKYLKIKEIFVKIQEFKDKGYLLFHNQELIEDYEIILIEDFKSGSWICAGYQVGNCVISLVDIEWDCRPSLKTLKEIYSTIDKLQFIDPLSAKKVR